MQPYDTGPKGIALIKEFEGFSAIPYQCPAGIWTIGYGATKDREINKLLNFLKKILLKQKKR